jgi:hypothetical protein
MKMRIDPKFPPPFEHYRWLVEFSDEEMSITPKNNHGMWFDLVGTLADAGHAARCENEI